VCLSRSGAASERARALVAELEASGCRISTPQCDIGDRVQLSQVLSTISKDMAPVRGCIQGALVLRDSGLAEMTHEDFQAALHPKVKGSWNLHELLPKGLDFFIMLSSFSGIVGFPGQANYCAGNTFQDALARHRVSRGEKATAIDIGMVSSVGFSAERPEVAKALRSRGYKPIRETELIAVLEYHCDPGLPLASPFRSQVVMGAETPAALREKGFDEPYWMSRPLFQSLRTIGSNRAATTSHPMGTESARDFSRLLGNVKSTTEAGAVVTEALVWKLARTLSISEGDIGVGRPMHSYGVDSLVAVDMRNWLQREIRAEVTASELLKDTSITALGMLVAARSKYLPASLAVAH